MGISEGDMEVVTFEPNRMNIMSPMMGMMHPKQNKGFLANLKRVLEGSSPSA